MEQQKNKSYALPIAVMFALFFMIAFVTGLPSPMGVIVANQFGATNFESQLGFAANFIAYAFMGIPAGIMLKRMGYKKTALAGIAIGFTGVFIQFMSGQASSFAVYVFGAFISGFSMCLLNTVVNPMLNTLGGGGNKGNQLLQTGGSLNSIGATITPVLVGYLMGPVAGRTIEKANPALWLAMGIFAFAFIVISLVQIPEPHMIKKSEEKATARDSHSPLSFRHFIFGIIAIFVYVGVEIGIPSTANLFMTKGLNVDATIAGSIVGVYWALMMIGRIAGAAIGAKVSTKAMMTVASALGLLLLLLAIYFPTSVALSLFGATVPVNVLFIVLCGICTSVMWGGIFNLAVEGLGKYTAAASGIFMVMVCGGGLVPLLQGFVADNAGYLNSYWVMIVCIAYILWYSAIGSKNVNKDIPVED